MTKIMILHVATKALQLVTNGKILGDHAEISNQLQQHEKVIILVI